MKPLLIIFFIIAFGSASIAQEHTKQKGGDTLNIISSEEDSLNSAKAISTSKYSTIIYENNQWKVVESSVQPIQKQDQATMTLRNDTTGLQDITDLKNEYINQERSVQIYLSTGLGLPLSSCASVTFLSKKGIGASFNFRSLAIRAENLPGNYTKNLWGAGGKPKDGIDVFALLFIKEFSSNNSKIRMGVEAGVSYSIHSVAHFTSYDPGLGVLLGATSNYTTDYTSHYSTGLNFRIRLKLPLHYFTGLEFALSGNINEQRPYVGLECLWLMGKLRKK